jgi:4-hydroxybenzoyl-CoA reductase subunit beta
MIAEKTYLVPETLDEAIKLALASSEDFKYIAGGTDVMANKFQENETSNCLIDITNLKELKGISTEDEFLRIGALERLSDLAYNQQIVREFPMLIEAALSVGSPLLRKTATIGGNILCENRCLYFNQAEWWREAVGYCLKCNGDICIATKGKNACFSELVSDTAPALIAMDAMVELFGVEGPTQLKLEDIYSGDGVKPLKIPTMSIVMSILLPLNQDLKTSFHKLRDRETLEFTSLTSAVAVKKNGSIKVVLGGVDPKPVVVEGTKNDDLDALIVKATKRSRAVENVMYSRTYRKEMIRVFLNQSFEELLS